MTTLIGIKAELDKEGVVLASDLNNTYEVWTQQGDVAYKQQTKHEAQKIYVDKARNLALGMTGVFDVAYSDFLTAIIDGQIDVRKAVTNGKFEELLYLNLNRWRGKLPNTKEINGLLLATRFEGKPKLYTCYPLGLIQERYVISIGSGSNYASDYLSKQVDSIPKGTSLKNAIDLVVNSLEEAARDIYTGGLDIIVVTKDGIFEYGPQIKNDMENAKRKAINRVKADFK